MDQLNDEQMEAVCEGAHKPAGVLILPNNAEVMLVAVPSWPGWSRAIELAGQDCAVKWGIRVDRGNFLFFMLRVKWPKQKLELRVKFPLPEYEQEAQWIANGIPVAVGPSTDLMFNVPDADRSAICIGFPPELNLFKKW